MTNNQKVSFLARWLLLKDSFSEIEFHQGQCIGADHDALVLVKSQGGAWTVSHPPLDDSKIHSIPCDETWPAKDYLSRNHDIVDITDLLIVAPETKEETRRSGTWITYRYAEKMEKPIFLILPEAIRPELP